MATITETSSAAPSSGTSEVEQPETAIPKTERAKDETPENEGVIVATLLAELTSSDLVFLAKDEVRAVEIAAALAAGAPDAAVIFCPGSDALPGDSAPPSPANIGQRAAALRKLRSLIERPGDKGDRPRIAMVSTGEAAARLYPSPDAFGTAPPILTVGEQRELSVLGEQLAEIGYTADDRVDEPGEFALRGQVIDVFPADAGEPYRIEVQDGTIATIRAYDPLTQLTHGECPSLEVGRANEPESSDGATLLDHLPAARVAFGAGADKRRQRFLAIAADAHRRRPQRAAKDICDEARWAEAINDRGEITLDADAGEPIPRFAQQRNPGRAFACFARETFDTGKTLVLLGTARDLRFLARQTAKLLKRDAEPVASWSDALAAEPGALLLLEMPLTQGFRIDGIVAVSAADLLGSRAQRDDVHTAASHAELFAMGEIKLGDVVVHEEHGLAVVAGLEELPGGGGDAIVLRFAADARRLVPTSQAHLIWRYGAEESAVSLDKLDGSSWQKRRGQIDEAVAVSARALVALAEERLTLTAPVLEPDFAAYERFAGSFPFTETPDQARAITAVRADLASGKPMDRLVVGDVGYGKTEVALRAAAVTALAGKQVLLAAPTTVLVRQHLETFTKRFEDAGIEVAQLSRLSDAAEKKRVKAGLKDGSIKVVVGTGALAGKDVEYHDLGLVIIDEEQRFGAADKDKLRSLSADAITGARAGHVLTLSATPIPRTLQQALVGLQQLSIIATPPARRQPIRTTVTAFDDQMVRTALIRERSRGGQSFVVVPRIEDMATMREKLERLAPELTLLEAHGKMPVDAIDDAMVRFARGDGDVLLATNIIEAGLDVPRANTMIVWRADRFGLSQLHQLRGRVGRGARRGQIYLLTHGEDTIAPRTLSRLQTLQAFDRLGAGFAISARDLDMRGAGDLLGDEQTGHVKLIGVDLYQHLLEQALRVARGEPVDLWTPTLNLGLEGRLPPEWIPEEDVRVNLYARLARIENLSELDAYEYELADRFGELPQDAQRLMALTRLRMFARTAEIEKVDAGPAAIALTFRRGVTPPQVDGLEEKAGRWILRGDYADERARTDAAEQLLAQLSGES
jgi:transcription-repair coupling factor (superfamily II helicase)